jgi:hypothetical protein
MRAHSVGRGNRMKRLRRQQWSVRSGQVATGLGIGSGRFLDQSGLRIRLGEKGPVAIDPTATSAVPFECASLSRCDAPWAREGE